MAVVSVINILILLAIFLVIPILIGVYVYRDSKLRNMNAALWTIIAVITPMLIGFIIYLLVRSSHSDLKCPSCAFSVTEQFVVCPNCGAKLKDTCPNCGIPVEPSWSVCPKCTVALPEQKNDFSPPVRKKDTALGKILLVIVLIPVLFLILFAILLVPFNFATSFSAMTTSSSLVASDFADNPEVSAWISQCNEDPTKVYALSHKTVHGDSRETNFLIYRPSPSGFRLRQITFADASISTSGFSGSNIDVRFSEEADSDLTAISFHSSRHVNLRVFQNGRRVNVEITEVDFNPTLALHNW